MGRFDRCCTLTVQKFLERWRCYLFIALVAAVIITGIVLLVLRLAFRPHVEASIEDARLTSFALVAAVIITGIVLLVLRLAFRPHVEASIEDARLTSFALGTTASFLEYNISVAIRIHNPTWGIVKHTKPLVAAITFHDNSLLNVSVAGEGHKYRPSKKEVYLLHQSGEVSWDVLGRAALGDFKEQNKTGVFKVEVRLSGEITNLGLDNVVIGNKRNLGFSCPLSLQLAPPGHGVVIFHEVNCKPEPQNIYFDN